MGKSTRRALLGFAIGAGTAAQSFYQTKAAQEAEALREQRLAAIRAEERGQDRQFAKEMADEQNRVRQDERADDRSFSEKENQLNRDAARENQQIQAGASRAYTDAQAASAEYGIYEDESGNLVSMLVDDPRLQGGGKFVYKGSMRGRAPGSSPAPSPQAPAPGNAPGTGVLMSLRGQNAPAPAYSSPAPKSSQGPAVYEMQRDANGNLVVRR